LINSSLLQIEMEQKLNISELKQKRWMLSMKKLLTSFNNTIVDGLIQWKNNIDQEFEGIEVDKPANHSGVPNLL
jgi:hypothetical protein